MIKTTQTLVSYKQVNEYVIINGEKVGSCYGYGFLILVMFIKMVIHDKDYHHNYHYLDNIRGKGKNNSTNFLSKYNSFFQHIEKNYTAVMDPIWTHLMKEPPIKIKLNLNLIMNDNNMDKMNESGNERKLDDDNNNMNQPPLKKRRMIF